MSVEFKVHENLNLIEVNLSDYITLEAFLEARKALKELCLKHGIGKVLLNAMEGTRLDRKAPLVILYREFYEHKLPLSMPVAVLIGVGHYPFLEYLESITRNQGRPVRIFHSRDDALAWLDASPFTPHSPQGSRSAMSSRV